MKNIMKYLGIKKDPKTIFTEVVKENFAFLIEEFGFSFSIKPTRIKNDPFVDGVAEFRTSKTIVTINSDLEGVVLVFLRSSKDPSSFIPIITLLSVVEFVSPETNITSLRLWPDKGEKWEPWIKRQIIEKAKVLRKYSHQILDKESSEWIDYIVHNRKKAEILYQATPNQKP